MLPPQLLHLADGHQPRSVRTVCPGLVRVLPAPLLVHAQLLQQVHEQREARGEALHLADAHQASSVRTVCPGLGRVLPAPLLVHAQLLQQVHELRVARGEALHLAHARLRRVFARRRGDARAELAHHVRVQLVHAGGRCTGM